MCVCIYISPIQKQLKYLKKKKARDSMTEDENEVQLKSKTAYKVCVECHPSPIPRNNCPQAKY